MYAARFRAVAKMNESNGYSWESGIERSWDSLQQDDSGSLVTVANAADIRANRRSLERITAPIRRGVIRYLIIILDVSAGSGETDLKPSRLGLSIKLAKVKYGCFPNSFQTCLQTFVVDFFDQNPISNLAIMITRDGTAERITELSARPQHHIDVSFNCWHMLV